MFLTGQMFAKPWDEPNKPKDLPKVFYSLPYSKFRITTTTAQVLKIICGTIIIEQLAKRFNPTSIIQRSNSKVGRFRV
jgi:hypothetical protein